MKTIIIENGKYLIRSVTATDKEPYMRIQQENSEMAKAYDENNFRDYFWENILKGEDDIYMMVFRKESNTHVGNCSFQGIKSDAVEIGVDIDKPYQNRGIGTDILGMLIRYAAENILGKRLLIKTKSDNMQCRRMIEKAGGIKVGKEPTGFDRMIEKMIPLLLEKGFIQEAEESRDLRDITHDICVYIYEFMLKEDAG